MTRHSFPKVARLHGRRGPEIEDESDGRMKRTRLLAAVIVFAVAALATACAPASGPTAVATGPTAPPTLTETRPTPVESAPATLPPQAAPTETRPVVSEQYATDPATVNLAAGRPTLVKFFAFW